ncbi:hypothetical protein N9M16_07465 [Candidatus Dependentiae bacterium]|nr:hypothetical protein [Candidatus Dependentiae bacterium]
MAPRDPDRKPFHGACFLAGAGGADIVDGPTRTERLVLCAGNQ